MRNHSTFDLAWTNHAAFQVIKSIHTHTSVTDLFSTDIRHLFRGESRLIFKPI
jgi:hypothetical protein